MVAIHPWNKNPQKSVAMEKLQHQAECIPELKAFEVKPLDSSGKSVNPPTGSQIISVPKPLDTVPISTQSFIFQYHHNDLGQPGSPPYHHHHDDEEEMGREHLGEEEDVGHHGILEEHDGKAKPKFMGKCKVCGDDASGMYFGALVCVPCKVSDWLQDKVLIMYLLLSMLVMGCSSVLWPVYLVRE